MPRTLFLVALGMFVVTIAFLVMDAVLRPPPGVTQAKVRRLRPGMTLADVEAVLGGRPKRAILGATEKTKLEIGMLRKAPSTKQTFTSYPYALTLVILDEEPTGPMPEPPGDKALRFWVGPEGEMEVLFGPDERVKDFKFWPTTATPSRYRSVW